MPRIQAKKIGECKPGDHIQIGDVVYVRMHDSTACTDRHIEEYLFDPKTGWWGHWSRLINGEEMVVLLSNSPEQSLINEVKRLKIKGQLPESCRSAAITALQSALPIIDAYRRLSGGDGDVCAMNIREVLRSMDAH